MLIKDPKEHYWALNMLVSFCEKPWDVDLKLGSHGLCYFGNFGDKPGVVNGINIIRRNYFNKIKYNN
jgi:hypothetical protein